MQPWWIHRGEHDALAHQEAPVNADVCAAIACLA
jgi:hypothetical protein